VFLFADSADDDFFSQAPNEAAFRCSTVQFFDAGTNLMGWTQGNGFWSLSSDRNAKENIQPVDTADVLARVAALPVSSWNYIGTPRQHVGPVAQDFHALFPWSGSDTTLSSGDLQGVTLAALKELLERARARDEEIRRLRKLEAEISAAERALGIAPPQP
jgi:hypothetical protein